MSPWLLVIIVLVILYAMHVRRLRARIAGQADELRRALEKYQRVEKMMTRRGRRLDVLLSAVNEAVMRVDNLGRVRAANDRARQVFNMDEALGLPQSMIVFYRDARWHRTFIRAVKALPEPSFLPDIHVDGLVLAARLAPLGKNQALLLCVDMTQQARLEEQRQTFLSNLMHDIKTPLTSMLGYARSIQSFGDDAGLRGEAMQVIADEAKRVNSLLDALLTLDRIQHSMASAQGQADLTDIWRQVCDALKADCTGKGIRIQTAIPADLPALAIPADFLHRVLMNLLSNAVHHSPAGGLVSLGVDFSDGRAAIELCDEGPGIPDQDLEHVTERFYRVDKERGRMDGGHGLGLAIVKELLDRSGGSLQLGNREPHGLRVQFILPVSLQAESVHDGARQAISAGRADPVG